MGIFSKKRDNMPNSDNKRKSLKEEDLLNIVGGQNFINEEEFIANQNRVKEINERLNY